MASAVWPAGLPQGHFFPIRVVSRPQIVRMPTTTGPGKTRRVSSVRVEELGAHLKFTATELATFDTFFFTTLAGGSLRFDREHPRTRAIVEMEFQAYPQFELASLGPDRWIGEAQLLAFS